MCWYLNFLMSQRILLGGMCAEIITQMFLFKIKNDIESVFVGECGLFKN